MRQLTKYVKDAESLDTAPHCPHSNPDTERMINDQMEAIHRRFEYEIGYDLHEVLFTNNLKAFHNRSSKRSTGIEFVNSNQHNHQDRNPEADHQIWNGNQGPEQDSGFTEANDNMITDKDSLPLNVIFSKEIQQEWER